MTNKQNRYQFKERASFGNVEEIISQTEIHKQLINMHNKLIPIEKLKVRFFDGEKSYDFVLQKNSHCDLFRFPFMRYVMRGTKLFFYQAIPGNGFKLRFVISLRQLVFLSYEK